MAGLNEWLNKNKATTAVRLFVSLNEQTSYRWKQHTQPHLNKDNHNERERSIIISNCV